MRKLLKKYSFVFSVSAMIVSCSNYDPKKNDSPTRGEINILADEGYRTLMEDFKFYFTNTYPDAQININYTSETDALNKLITTDYRIAVLGCEPGENEKNYFKSKGLTYYTKAIGYDAIVLIVNKDTPIDSLHMDEVKSLIKGEITSLNQLKKNASDTKLQLLFDSPGSGLARYLVKTFLKEGTQLPGHFAATNSNREVIENIKKNKNLIGFINYNLISDKDDTLAQRIKREVKVLYLSSATDSVSYFKPAQTTIADKSYPLVRTIYAINREGKSGLGTGFVIFMADHKGQRIMLKAGMVPAVFPGRDVRIVRKNIAL